MKAIRILLVSVVGLAACGGEDLGGGGPASDVERAFGGPAGLLEYFETHTEEENRRAMEAYGIGFQQQALITDCPQFFPSADRNKWHTVSGEYYYIDGSGRPHRAYAYLPPVVAEARSTTCQTNVGQWGDAESTNDYDGGHLIGSQLGGYGRRANLVPQDANFNRGNWAVLENKMATCSGLPAGRLRYYIGANYPNGSTLIPNNLTMQITNQSTGASVSLSFSNTDGGGSNGTSEKNRGVSFLSSQGCN